MPPSSSLDNDSCYLFAGFWIRVGAALLDTALLLLLTAPLTYAIYGDAYMDSMNRVLGNADIAINYVFPLIYVLLFWRYKAATPGKIIVGIQVIDAKTGNNISIVKGLVRYLGYILSSLPLLLGFIWVGFDKKKQGWHDKIAGTYVVYTKKNTES